MRRLTALLVLVVGIAGCRSSSNAGNVIAAALLKLVGVFPTAGLPLQERFRYPGTRWDYARGQPTQWSSSTIGGPDKIPIGRTDILQIGVTGAYIGPSDLVAFNSAFPEGQGSFATRVSANVGATLNPGYYAFYQMTLGDKIPINVNDRYFQYAFVADQDEDTGNNYNGQPPFDKDFFTGSDIWWQLRKQPNNPWQLTGTDARDSMPTTRLTNALALLCEEVFLLMVPMSEFPELNYYSSYRATAFEHGGDFGQNPPYDWSGSDRPSRDAPLATINTSTLLRFSPKIELAIAYAAVEQDFFTNINHSLEDLGNYSSDSFNHEIPVTQTSDYIVDNILVGGIRGGYSLAPGGLAAGLLFPELVHGGTPISTDHAGYSRAAGKLAFDLDPADRTTFTPSLSLSYQVNYLGGGSPSFGELLGNYLNDAEKTALINEIDSDTGRERWAVPMLYLNQGQRHMTQLLDRMTPVNNLEAPFRDQASSFSPLVTDAWTGPVLDLLPGISDDRSINLTWWIDTRGITLQSPETINVEGAASTIRLPIMEVRNTITSVRIPEGQTVLLGGIQPGGAMQVTEGIPFLGDVPVLNKLFAPSTKVGETRIIIVFITPRIIDSMDYD